ncbi:MAG TPA: hypothetical protein VKY92_22170 [Verrucomicrobiae bacterium]|nr:hypothetical protein [Verrucomicrobiae bacterium]
MLDSIENTGFADLAKREHHQDLITFEKRVAGRLVAKFVAGEQEAATLDLLLNQLCRTCDTSGRSRPVMVTEILDQSEYDERMRTGSAKPLTQRVFPSAMAASVHFGYHWNAVMQALRRAKATGRDFARVAGLLVAWLDEMPGLK